MSFTDNQIIDLSAPLNMKYVKKRDSFSGSGKLSYIEGWHVINVANRIFGFDKWHRKTELNQLGSPEVIKDRNNKDQWRVRYMAKSTIIVMTDDLEISRDGIGYGSGYAKDLGDAFESAIKEAETDAMKRAFMTFGNQFGLALYDKQQNEVANDAQISAYKARKDGSYPTMEKDIRACRCEDELDAWISDNKEKINLFPDNWKDHLREEAKRKRESLREHKVELELEVSDPEKFLDDIEMRMNIAPDIEILNEVLDEFNSAETQFSFHIPECSRIESAFKKNSERLCSSKRQSGVAE